MSASNQKRNNDPWVPLDNESESSNSHNGTVVNHRDNTATRHGLFPVPAPQDPLHQMIDSERYIQSLEKKLAKIKSTRKEPTSKEIIQSLSVFHEDQMRRFVDDNSLTLDMNLDNSIEPTGSFIKRKLYPDRQPLSAEEVVEILKQDILALNFEDSSPTVDEMNTTTHPVIQQPKLSIISTDKPSRSGVNASVSLPNDGIDNEGSISVDSSNTSESWANFDEMKIDSSQSQDNE